MSDGVEEHAPSANQAEVEPGKSPRFPPAMVDARTSVPTLAAEVPRPGLEALLDTCSTHRLTVVSAGPGWGKTTAVAGWTRRSLARRAQATAWLTLTPGDDTPALFWEGVLRAIDRSGVVPEGHPLSSATMAGGVSDQVLLTLWRGFRALPRQLVLILDDFHVIEDQAVLESLEVLLSHETSVNVVLVTRHDPALPLHRLRLAGDLAEVGVSDLAFDTDTVTRLAARTESLRLAPHQVDTILERTEGWPAGVTLAVMYLTRTPDDPALERFGGTLRSVAEFLLAEVLEQHDSATRDFLLRTSVVEWLTGELADALVPGGEGLARLEMLARTGAFVTCIDDARPIYRYHPLLRDLLLHLFRRDDVSAYRAARRAAARWLDAEDEPVEALGQAVAAEDWRLAGEVFFRAAPWLVTGRRFRLQRHLQDIPYEQLTPTAARELCAAGAELVGSRYDAVSAHAESARVLAREGDGLSPLGSAVMEVLDAAAARPRGDLRKVVDAATASLGHLAHSPPTAAVERLRAIAVHQRAIGCLMQTGDVAVALAAFSMVADAADGDTTLTSFNARAYRSWCLVLAGRLDEAEAAARELLRHASELGWSSLPDAHPAHLALATLHLLRAEGPKAYRAAFAALANPLPVTELWPTVSLHLTRASIAVVRNRPRAAVTYLEDAVAVRGSLPLPPALADTWTRTCAEVAVLVGGEPATRTPEEAEPAEPSATWWSSRARRALAHADLDAAEAAAHNVPRRDEDLPDAAGLSEGLAAIEAWLVLAVVADRRRHPHESTVCVRAAVDLARPQRLIQPFVATEATRIADILRRAVHEGIVHRDDFVRALMSRSTPESTLGEPNPLIEPLTEREMAILAELPTLKNNAEIAAEFYVSINTVKTHLQHLFRKLDVANRRQAVRRARELGLLT